MSISESTNEADIYFHSFPYDDEAHPISDEKYAFSIQFQEVLMSSIVFSSSSSTLQQQPVAGEKYAINTPFQELLLTLKPCHYSAVSSFSGSSSSGTKMVLCEICADLREPDEMFQVSRGGCPDHQFCNQCISMHVAAKVRDNALAVTCPGAGCKAPLEMEHCKGLLPPEVFLRWSDALCEKMVLESGSGCCYCPFRDCSAAMIVDEESEGVTMSECPSCRRLFCAKCGVGWHAGVDCEEYQRMGKEDRSEEDLMLVDLAEKRKWKRCPQCKFYVERNEGCLHMTCRCKYQFCYGCGFAWSDDHESCSSLI